MYSPIQHIKSDRKNPKPQNEKSPNAPKASKSPHISEEFSSKALLKGWGGGFLHKYKA